MRKLIEIESEHEVVCDNPKCDFVVPNKGSEPSDSIEYLDVPCPKCGENLLTMKDYLMHNAMLRKVAWLNKWFSWTTVFYSRKAKRTEVTVYVHNGIKVER